MALDATFRLAALLHANVAGYHIRPERREQRITLGPLLPDDDVHAAFALADEKTASHQRAAHALYRRAAAKYGFAVGADRGAGGARSRASWHEVAGTPARVFAVVGPVADLIVLSRPATEGTSLARTFLLGAVLHSAKPVLLLPQAARPTLGTRIAVAWNQSADAASAVTAALPLLTRAERVVVVSAGRENRLGPKVTDLARYLRHWNVKVERVRTRGEKTPSEIERAAHDVGADLLVMGAYSRNRFRQLVFGGATEHMLFKTDLPVLMLHR